MPLILKHSLKNNTDIFFWKISEDYHSLFHAVDLKNASLERLQHMKSKEHQKGFLAVRMILQHIGYTDHDLYYDNHGKPHLLNGKHISISHSHEFSAVALSDVPLGLDLEKIKEKTLKISPRFMDTSHLANLSIANQLIKATVVWGIKETVFKIKNEKGISFPNHIAEERFTIEDKHTFAYLNFKNATEKFEVYFNQIEDYIFVCTFLA